MCDDQSISCMSETVQDLAVVTVESLALCYVIPDDLE